MSTAGNVMDTVAALLNDSAKQNYSYVVQLPYLKVALKELRELFELNNSPVTNATSAVITLPATVTPGITTISSLTIPALPTGLVEIQKVWERATGTDPYTPMTRKEFIPHHLEGILTNQFSIWVWENESIKVLSSLRSNDIKLDYIQELFNSVVDQNSTIGVINADSFLHYRTAGLCAEFVGENKTRADALNGDAILALDRVLGISNKGRQTIATRHRPFRTGFKSRGLW